MRVLNVISTTMLLCIVTDAFLHRMPDMMTFPEPRKQHDPLHIRVTKHAPPSPSISNPCEPINSPFLHNECLILQLYGEWSLWHSTAPNFRHPNSVMIYLYPHSRIEMSLRRTVGPFLFEDRRKGDYCVVGTSDRVLVEFSSLDWKILSLFGIGFEVIPILIPLDVPAHIQNMNLDLSIVGNDDLFLTSDHHSYHLVRSIRTNEPSINVPFSTLVATQLTGMYITYCVEQLLKLIHSR
jgi:hypothetical protein